MALQPSTSTGGGPAVRPMTVQHEQEDRPGDDAESEGDFIDRIIENYNFICHPELRLKFKQQLNRCYFSVALAKPWHHRHRLRCVIKPAGGTWGRFLQKVLAVPTHGLLCAYSGKIPLWFLRIQFMASFNWVTKKPTLDYRVTTKWSEGARIKRKERYHVGQNALLRCKWNMDLQLPDMEGHLGTDNQEVEALDVDYGRLDFEISQLDLVVDSPWGPRPGGSPTRAARETQEGSSSGSGRAAAAGQRPAGNTAQQGPGNSATAADTSRQGRFKWPGRGQAREMSKGDTEQLGKVLRQELKVPKADLGKGVVGVTTPSDSGQLAGGVPDWLVTFLSKLSVPTYTPPGKQL